MDTFKTILDFIINISTTYFHTILLLVLGIIILYSIIYFDLEYGYICISSKRNTNKKINIKKIIFKIKGKLYGINPEFLEKLNEQQHLKI